MTLEQEIQKGKIKSFKLKVDGKIVDLNADVFDQLATVDEGIRDLQDFALLGQFPELSEFEIQAMVRELEAAGFLEPVDLTTARRETSDIVGVGAALR